MEVQIGKNDEVISVDGTDGLSFRKTLIENEDVQLVEWVKKKGSWAEEHDHPDNDMLCYCISGSLKENINGKDYVFQKGDAWFLSKGSHHSCVFLEDSMILTIFLPPNKDYSR